MAKREFVMLCHTYKPAKHKINGWYVSEKLDGLRCFWDGGVTRGNLAAHVQWANTEKDDRYVDPPKATGLWTRRGKPVQAPDWFLNSLPVGIPLDGELYAGVDSFQEVSGIVRDLNPGPGWAKIKFHVFDSPAYMTLFEPGYIKYGTSKKLYSFNDYLEDIWPILTKDPRRLRPMDFQAVQCRLKEWNIENDSVLLHPQTTLPQTTAAAVAAIDEELARVLFDGGEGIVLRNPFKPWEPCRSYNCLKYKPEVDDEGKVVGYTWGRATDRGSKLLGLMGNLVVQWMGKEFELSGFTEAERVMHMCYSEVVSPYDWPYTEAKRIGEANPGKRIDHRAISNILFPIGSTVTFKYSGRLTEDGIPKEARYFRKRHD